MLCVVYITFFNTFYFMPSTCYRLYMSFLDLFKFNFISIIKSHYQSTFIFAKHNVFNFLKQLHNFIGLFKVFRF